CPRPAESRRSARRRSCVVLPAPSGPSSTISAPRDTDQSTEGDDGTRRTLFDPLEDPVVRAAHDLVEVLLRHEQLLIARLALNLTEERVELVLHVLRRTLAALHHPLRVYAELLHLLEQRDGFLVFVQRVAGTLHRLVLVALSDQPSELLRL